VRGASLRGLAFIGLGLSVHEGTPAIPAEHVEKPSHAGTEAFHPEPSNGPVSSATRYASLSSEACLAELDARHIGYRAVDRLGVETPVRLAGPLSGVTVRTLLPEKERERSPYEIFDCRLVLALDDFAKILAAHGIVDVMHYSAFRPLVPGVVKRGHESALAIDIAFFGRADGSAYSILRDFTPIAREHPCTPIIRAAGPRELRAIACEAADQGLFHVVLTPDYDAAHRDHFHLEIVPGAETSFAR
jgi:hypothetical protein